MNQILILVFVCNLSLSAVNAVRVSPKLDFGESDQKVSAGIRPSVPRYQNDRFTYKTVDAHPVKTDNIEVICVSGNCTTTKVKTDSDGSVSADVLVHIKTNLDVPENKSNTVETVPDVPIVVGTKTSTTDNGRPIGIPNSFLSPPVGSSYPRGNTFSPISSTAFVPSGVPTFFQSVGLQSDSQVRGFGGSNNYAPRFQGNTNGIDFQSSSFNSGSLPSDWYPRRSGNGAAVYNPVEFRKTYSNIWTPVNWSRSSSGNHERHNVGIPRWTPCVCQNPEAHNLPTTANYPPPNHPAGINGKLGTLI